MERVTAKDFYFETFKEIVEGCSWKPYFCGDKLYIYLQNNLLVTVRFIGSNPRSLNVLRMEAKSRSGIIDELEIPFSRIFYETKRSNMDKTVVIKTISASAGGSEVSWSVRMDQEDYDALNNIVLDYIDIFSMV